jgi:hypothetical protein
VTATVSAQEIRYVIKKLDSVRVKAILETFHVINVTTDTLDFHHAHVIILLNNMQKILKIKLKCCYNVPDTSKLNKKYKNIIINLFTNIHEQLLFKKSSSGV